MAQHSGLAVVNHHLGCDTAKILKRILVTSQPVFLSLGQGELDIHPAAESQHHDKEAQMPFDRADLDQTRVAPVNLGALAWIKMQ